MVTLSPFISLELLFTDRVFSIVSFPSANGMTIQYLFLLTTSNKENQQNNVFFARPGIAKIARVKCFKDM